MAQLSDKDLIYNVYLFYLRIKYDLKGISRIQFENNKLLTDATKYRLIQIGINSSKLSEKFTKRYPSFPWYWITALDTEGYFDDSVLWDVIKSRENGIMKYFDQITKIFIIENPEEAKEFNLEIKPLTKKDLSSNKKDLSLSKDYKYPIHSKSSLWTVEKK